MGLSPRKYKKRSSQHRRLKVQTKAINSVNWMLFYVLVLVICVVAHLFALPQYKKLKAKKEVLADVLVRVEEAEMRKDRAMRENRALQEDPEYMELISRDILNYYKPGETIFNIRRK